MRGVEGGGGHKCERTEREPAPIRLLEKGEIVTATNTTSQHQNLSIAFAARDWHVAMMGIRKRVFLTTTSDKLISCVARIIILILLSTLERRAENVCREEERGYGLRIKVVLLHFKCFYTNILFL